ncbi:hypothetical protein GGI10_000784 [Coemansia sp. RSA 2530]|nr:hypothetical protein GGI10_000784 [Coemansia sp. RSA 2530]
MMTGAATLVDFNSNPHSPFPNDLLYRCVMGRETIGLFVFFLSIFTTLASLSVFSYTHWQLATLQRPLRWSDTLLSSVTFAATGSALALGAAILGRNHGQ